jgi:hypothetical protein
MFCICHVIVSVLVPSAADLVFPKPTSLCSFFSSCTAFILEATNSNFIIFGLTRQEHKICRTWDEHAHNYMTDTKHSLPSILDNIKPKVHRIVNIFLRLYDFINLIKLEAIWHFNSKCQLYFNYLYINY